MTTTFTYNAAYQARIDNTLETALANHKRTIAIRVDLRMPNDDSQAANTSAVITRFFESLKAKLQADIRNKERAWQRSLTCKITYVWVREFGPINGKMHFHLLLFLNKDVYFSLGDFQQDSGNLAAMIKQAWCSALHVGYHAYQQLVHFPAGGVLYLDAGHPDFMAQRQKLLEKSDYLAKEATKQYGDGARSFGCSRGGLALT